MHYRKSNRLGQNEKVTYLDFMCDIILFCYNETWTWVVLLATSMIKKMVDIAYSECQIWTGNVIFKHQDNYLSIQLTRTNIIQNIYNSRCLLLYLNNANKTMMNDFS